MVGGCGDTGEQMLIVSATPSEPPKCGCTVGFRPRICVMQMGDTADVRVLITHSSHGSAREEGRLFDADALPEPLTPASGTATDYEVLCSRLHNGDRCEHCMQGWDVADRAQVLLHHEVCACVCGAVCTMPVVPCGCCGVAAVYAVLGSELHHPHLAVGLQLLLHAAVLLGHPIPHAPMLYRSLNLETPRVARTGGCGCDVVDCVRCVADAATLRCVERVRTDMLPWNRK